MDDREKNRTVSHNCWEPWDSGFYETGSTRPPRDSAGPIAVLLVVGILLFSAFNSVMRFFPDSADPQPRQDDGDARLAIVTTESTEEPTGDSQEATLPPETQGGETGSPSGTGNLELHTTPQGVENIPQEGGLSLQEIYEKLIDSVVSITASGQSGTASGSGVVLSADGYLVTNAHVVENAGTIQVLLTDERTFRARLVGEDSLTDLAVLWIDAADLKPAEFGDSSALRVGDAVVAIGDPLGVELRGTMTDGIVSAINRDITSKGRTMTLIQTNAALNAGNSGGPLVNCYGQVVGINTMKISALVSSDTSVEGLGFAIPSTTVKEIVDQLIRQGYVTGRPTLGLEGEDVSLFNQSFYHLPAGLYVTAVVGEEAEASGIAAGDVILSVAGVRISGADDVRSVLYDHSVGDTVSIVFYRSGRQMETRITLTQAK